MVISEDGQRALPHDGNLGTFGTHHNLGTAGSGQWKYDPDNRLGVGGAGQWKHGLAEHTPTVHELLSTPFVSNEAATSCSSMPCFKVTGRKEPSGLRRTRRFSDAHPSVRRPTSPRASSSTAYDVLVESRRPRRVPHGL
jgi:hypothetical protein